MSSFAPKRTASLTGPPAVALRAAAAARLGPAVRRAAVLVPACYLLAALVVTWRLWADPDSRVVAGNPHDADLFAWYLRYAAAAVWHGHLPALATTAMNAPRGVNLMWNTPVLLPGILLSPVTVLLGPQVSLTIMTTAGFAGSATAMYWVLRRWQLSVGAAALAGAVYGFSPALLQASIGHYNLQLAVLPPLIVDAGLRLAAGRPAAAAGRDSERPPRTGTGWLARVPVPVRDGTWLGLLVTAEFFISEEIAFTAALAGLLLAAGLAAARPLAAVRRIGQSAAGLAAAAVVFLALAGSALLTQFAGPLTQHGALFPPDFYVNDLTGFVTPSGYLLFRTAGSAAAAARYQGGVPEYLGYLGWPLIAVLVLAALACWRRPAGPATALTLAALAVFSLGGHPLLDGKTYASVNLPWHWVETLPLMASALPDRLSILTDAAAAALLALGIDATLARLAARRAVRAAGMRPATAARAPALVMAVAVLACLPLAPRPLPAAATIGPPAGWSATFAALDLPSGARVLVVPVPNYSLTLTLRWQADTGQPSSMVGGYFIGPGTGGQPYIGGNDNGITPTSSYLDRLWAAGLPPGDPSVSAARAADLATASGQGPASAGQVPTAAQVRADFATWQPAAVVAVAPAGSPLGRYLIKLLGLPTVRSGSILAWR